eukprot:3879828-Ditylum_brightwellii.AAC.1
MAANLLTILPPACFSNHSMQARTWGLCSGCWQFGCGSCCSCGGGLKNGTCGCFGFWPLWVQ